MSSEVLTGFQPAVQKAIPSALFPSPPQRAQQVVGFTLDSDEVVFGRDVSCRNHICISLSIELVLIDFSCYYNRTLKRSSCKKILHGISHFWQDTSNYSFNYGVATPAVLVSEGRHQTYNEQPQFGHSEQRDGYRTQGRYYVQLPDGRTQVVEYYADETGYHPTVTYI